ncbi:EAL domain-containing protein [Deinococcus maricopensis]|uniref:Diguanylate phosphodiesterase n=1 Tax=Deinococcus maricopensis (strain DSM 21211 / LMG 22137 / NRRL B-23946 / LB-34) TaxID=709986 RepID=E8U9X1_DEIML|nr:EAL domain-containing protein [Deinococcus maricopensis]ADV67860.1 diguanylate phosphodiesterase [Deinococcus maricopensis DSM 21211]
MTVRAHACDCDALPHAAHVPTRLLVYARGTHVRQRLAALILAGNLGEAYDDSSHLLSAPSVDAVRALMHALTPLEAEEVHAMPHADGRLHYAEARPLRTWLTRLETTWFPQVAANLRFAYQPIVHANSDVLGFEALMRAQDGDRPVPPLDLLEAATAHDAARALDAQARIGAIQQGVQRLPPGANIFVNFAPSVVYNPDVCLRTTFRACREAQVDPRRLVFEVVETEAYPDLPTLRRVLERYREEGMRVALDDLGAGYASLLYLEALRPDFVKLDRDLVRGVHDADPRVALIGAITRYAHDLGIDVIAEGIETPKELRLALELGVDAIQGYLLARPAHELDPAVLAQAQALVRAHQPAQTVHIDRAAQ